jgi:hypothetical protein
LLINANEFKASGQLTGRNPRNRVAIPLRLREIAAVFYPVRNLPSPDKAAGLAIPLRVRPW